MHEKRLRKLARRREEIAQELARHREIERRRRTKALILLGDLWIDLVASGRWSDDTLEWARKKLSGGQGEVDLFSYVLDEVENRWLRSRSLDDERPDRSK